MKLLSVIVIVILTVALICSSTIITQHDVLAKKKKVTVTNRGEISCFNVREGPVKRLACCQDVTYSDGIEVRMCTICDSTQPPSNCGKPFILKTTNPGGVVNIPPIDTNVAPSTKVCPDNSAPDADGKCPPVTQGDSGSKEKGKNPKGPTDTGVAGLAVSDEGASGKKPVKK
jgi:hypothetical protein